MNSLITYKEVSIRRVTFDRYGRKEAELIKDEKIFKNLSLKMDLERFTENIRISVNGAHNYI